MIDILLATHNGEKFVREQIDSILNQTYQEFNIIIQDDCSTDMTQKIIYEYKDRFPDKIIVFVNKVPTGCATKNFLDLAKKSKSKYVMFCDQDDVWVNDKIEVAIKAMKELEIQVNNKKMPLLIHTDLKVVDEDLNLINESLFKYQKMKSSRDKINNLLVQNIVTGCTIMCNRELILFLDFINNYDFVIMYDWWMALIATTFGKIKFIDKPTVLYRQHKKNQVGAKNVVSLSYLLNKLLNFKTASKIIYDTYGQAQGFLNIYCEFLNCSKNKTIRQYANINKHNKLKRCYILFKYRFFKYGFFRKIGQLIKVCFN